MSGEEVATFRGWQSDLRRSSEPHRRWMPGRASDSRQPCRYRLWSGPLDVYRGAWRHRIRKIDQPASSGRLPVRATRPELALRVMMVTATIAACDTQCADGYLGQRRWDCDCFRSWEPCGPRDLARRPDHDHRRNGRARLYRQRLYGHRELACLSRRPSAQQQW